MVLKNYFADMINLVVQKKKKKVMKNLFKFRKTKPDKFFSAIFVKIKKKLQTTLLFNVFHL